MRKILLVTIITLTSTYFLTSCKKKDDKPAIKTLCDSVTYNTMVKPIFTQHCNLAGCHISGAGNVDLRTYEKAKEAAQTKELIKAIKHELDADRNMPRGSSKLSQRKIDIIECWVNKGFPE